MMKYLLFLSITIKKAWNHHKRHNPHHPEYWFDVKKNGQTEPLEMPLVNVAEMVADWMGAGITYGNTLYDWLPDNLPKFLFHEGTVTGLRFILYNYLGIKTKSRKKGVLEVVDL